MKNPALVSADAYCRTMTAGHYENFIVASPFVSARLRVHLARIYAFCRTTDDLGDESATKADALARLTRWRDEVCAMFEGETPVHPVLFALQQTLAEHSIPAHVFLDLIEANVLDQTQSHYASWPDLEAYCRLSAAPVGLMVLAVFGIEDPQAARLSDDVCIGLQLANHAQDVARDARIGRRYLLDDELAAGGVPFAVRGLVDRARTLLDSGRALEATAPFALRLQLSLYRLGGLAVCDAIERIDYRTDETRPAIAGAAKARVVGRAILQSLRHQGATGVVETA